MLSFIENIGLILQRYGAVFAQGLWNTLWLSFVSVFLGTFLGILVALGKLSRHKLLNGVVSTYIEIIRGTPILLQLISSGWLCRIFCRAFRIRPAF